MILNALTFDVEDYFQVTGFASRITNVTRARRSLRTLLGEEEP